MDSVQIILIEILLVLVAGIGFFFFRAQKKKSAMRSELAELLKKVTAEEPERKTMLVAQFKALGIDEKLAEERSVQLLDAEKACIRHFISFQLIQKEKDIASFHESIYGLSAVYFAGNDKKVGAVQELAANVEPDSNIEEKETEAVDSIEEDGDIEIILEEGDETAIEAPEKDEIDVSLDIEEIDEIIDLKSESESESEPEPELPKSSIIEEKKEPFDIDDIVNEAFNEVESGSKKPDDV
ncbi:MAG: hypothetical protein QNK15_12405 [Cycloclasticus sp.]|nr:hypothetical protein [Cycloclasticus sp.]